LISSADAAIQSSFLRFYKGPLEFGLMGKLGANLALNFPKTGKKR
jgi:hypothetical protein